ncbi:flagellar basal body P-ring formation chaperone FlgA [Oxalicibacterium flavum]|nr:flagellar basal body P-ring formation chaperone FlgA [Oxalicibacterium flavum]
MKAIFGTMLAALCMAAPPVWAQAAETPRQDINVIQQTVEQFLVTQAAGLPGEVKVTVGAIDSRLRMPACTVPQAFMPPGGKAWGKTTVGVRCTAPSPWTIYVAAQVKVYGEYLAAAVPLAQGQTIGETDLARVKGDLTALPPGIIVDASQAVGRTTTSSVRLGAPLRQDALRNQQAIQQGQAVRVVYNGSGFSISSEARALNNANEGQMTQVRTQNGQVLSGIARLGGVVEMTY